MIGLAASEEDANRFRFFERAGNVAMLVMELHIFLAEVVPRFGGSTCVLAGSHAEKEGENNAAPNGVVTSIVGSDSSVIAAKHGWRCWLGSFVGEPRPGHAFDIDLVSGGEPACDVAGGFMIPRNRADLGQDGGSPVGVLLALVEMFGISEELS